MRRKSFEKLSPNGSNSHRITLRLRRPLSLAALFPINWIKSPAPQQPLAKSKDKGAEIIKLQTQLALMKDKAKALSFFRTVTGKYSKFYQTQLGLGPAGGLKRERAAAEKALKNAFKIVENEDTVLTYGSTLLRTNPKEAEQILLLSSRKKSEGLYASVMLTLSCSSRQRIS